jgi:hypothetical protein
MQDAQGPRDSEDGGDDAPRRAGLRLRDAEAVATVRRDMFGDGSLIDALAGPAAAPNAPGGNPPDPVASAQSAEPSPPEPDAAERYGDTARQKTLDAAIPAAPVPLADVPQSLDAIIDSFPAEPPAGQPHLSGNEAEESLAASVPDAPAVPGTAADPSGPPSGAVPAVAQPQAGISSLFDSLGGIVEQHGDRVQPTEEPPAPSAPILDLDMSMLDRSPGRRRLMRPEPESPAAALPTGAPRPSVGSEPQAPEIQPTGTETNESQPGAPDLDMSMLDRLPTRPVLQPEPQPDDDTEAGEIGAVAIPSPANAMAEPGARPGDFERGDAADAPQGFGELPQGLDASPFIETLAMPDFAEPSEPGPRYSEPLAAPNALGSPEPQVLPAHNDPVESAAQPMFDAAAKIAAEAQATAEVLDNLRRFLAPGAPGLEGPIELPGEDSGHVVENAPPHFPTRSPPHAHAHTPVRPNLHGGLTPFQSSGPAALMPMPMPVPDRKGSKSIYVLGFLTGVGLALMAGVALYLLINFV